MGGFAAGLLAALVYAQRKKLAFWATLDGLTPVLAVFAVSPRLVHLASGEAFGKPTALPWGIQLWGTRRHPSQVYETLAALLTLGLLWCVFRAELPPGVLCLRFVALTAGTRPLLEAFRGDSLLVFGGLRLAQILAWIGMATALWLLEKRITSAMSFSRRTSGRCERSAAE